MLDVSEENHSSDHSKKIDLTRQNQVAKSRFFIERLDARNLQVEEEDESRMYLDKALMDARVICGDDKERYGLFVKAIEKMGWHVVPVIRDIREKWMLKLFVGK